MRVAAFAQVLPIHPRLIGLDAQIHERACLRPAHPRCELFCRDDYRLIPLKMGNVQPAFSCSGSESPT
jgi:hypothetical protein